jgi:hypothetical protein
MAFTNRKTMPTKHYEDARQFLARLLAEIAYKQLKQNMVESQQPQIKQKAA